MINIQQLIEEENRNGYTIDNSRAKVCQDIVLKAISQSTLSRNTTIKGGVVMRSKTGNVRRATQDLDIDFIKYSLEDNSIDKFIKKLNCLEGISLDRVGDIEELKQQEYSGKRVHIIIKDSFNNKIKSKIDLGVHKHLEIEQEEYCFDIAYDDNGASLLINTNEQMFAEKLRSLLKFGALSTRYKDVFDLYYLSSKINIEKLRDAIDVFIINDEGMRENNIKDIEKRLNKTFSDKVYRRNLDSSDKRWLDEDIDVITNGIMETIASV